MLFILQITKPNKIENLSGKYKSRKSTKNRIK